MRGIFGGHSGDGRQRKSTLAISTFEQYGEARLDARDATPDAEEIGVGLELGRTRRMVGGDHVDFGLEEVAPQGFDVGRGTQGRRALGDSAEADQRYAKMLALLEAQAKTVKGGS